MHNGFIMKCQQINQRVLINDGITNAKTACNLNDQTVRSTLVERMRQCVRRSLMVAILRSYPCHCHPTTTWSRQLSPCERRDALRASFKRGMTGPRGNPNGFLRAPLVTPAYICSVTWACACTQLEGCDPALRRSVLALHIVHVYRVVLALIVEPAAQ
jgi:hypothetical protein